MCSITCSGAACTLIHPQHYKEQWWGFGYLDINFWDYNKQCIWISWWCLLCTISFDYYGTMWVKPINVKFWRKSIFWLLAEIFWLLEIILKGIIFKDAECCSFDEHQTKVDLQKGYKNRAITTAMKLAHVHIQAK